MRNIFKNSGSNFLPSVLSLALSFALTGTLYADTKRSLNKTLGGQLAAAAEDLKTKIAADLKIKDSKFQIGEPVSHIPQSNFKPKLMQMLTTAFKDQIDSTSALTLTAEYKLLDPEDVQESDNKDRTVIELTLKIVNRRGGELQSTRREVNDSDDLTTIIGGNVALPDTSNFEERNKAIDDAIDNPSFHLRGEAEISSVGRKDLTVEIRAKSGGKGLAKPVKPNDRGGLPFVDLLVTDTFEIVVRNYSSSSEMTAKVLIDGLEVANTFSDDFIKDGKSYNGYGIPAAVGNEPGVHVIPGWLRTAKREQDNVFQFVINEFGKGAASAKNVTGDNLGVITVQFFRSAPLDESFRRRNHGEVGKGPAITVELESRESQIQDSPDSTVSIRYNLPLPN